VKPAFTVFDVPFHTGSVATTWFFSYSRGVS
jgi:hypothetical protein